MTLAVNPTRPQVLGAEVARLFSPAVSTVVVDAADGPFEVLPLEAAAVARAVPSRRREFSAGRTAARRAMSGLGLSGLALPQGPDRAPVWPRGVVGSLSHSGEVCVSAVAQSKDVLGIGIDIEVDSELDDDVLPIICNDTEIAWLDQQSPTERLHLAKIVFSAKETVYKFQYPLSRIVFGFDGLNIDLDLSSERFSASFMQSVGPFPRGTRLDGLFLRSRGWIVTALEVARSKENFTL